MLSIASWTWGFPRDLPGVNPGNSQGLRSLYLGIPRKTLDFSQDPRCFRRKPFPWEIPGIYQASSFSPGKDLGPWAKVRQPGFPLVFPWGKAVGQESAHFPPTSLGSPYHYLAAPGTSRICKYCLTSIKVIFPTEPPVRAGDCFSRWQAFRPQNLTFTW